MGVNTLFKIGILSLISFFMLILFCYHPISSNAQWDHYSYTSFTQQQWIATNTLTSILPLGEGIIDIMPWIVDTTPTNVITYFMSYPIFPTFSGSIDTLWKNQGVKTSGIYDSFLEQGTGLSCLLFPRGTGIPYCPGTSIKIKTYWRDPGNRLRNAIQWYGAPLPYGSEFTIYPVFPRGPTTDK